MTRWEQLAKQENFSAAGFVPTADICFNSDFRRYCAENLCGQYGQNYACPPDCGTPEEMRRRVLAYKYALVLQSKWDICDYSDTAAIKKAKKAHNEATLRIAEKLSDVQMVGASCCSLCAHCVLPAGKPCVFPQKRFSCLSAYCIHAQKLAERCGMEYTCADGKLALFSILLTNETL